MSEPIYHRPEEYDLEHARQQVDVRFYLELVRLWKPQRVLELGCGTGRITLPMAAMEKESRPVEVAGLELEPDMLQAAKNKTASSSGSMLKNIRWIEGDMRTWQSEEPFDLIVAPCGTLCHLLSIDDQLAAWRIAHSNLSPGGRFVAEVPMAEFARFAESMQVPPRAILEIDNDSSWSESGNRTRQLRYKTVLYDAATQCASVRFLYDEFQKESVSEQFLSDYAHHVYYPRELELLFRMTGFEIETVWGDFHQSPLATSSRQLIVVGRRFQ